MILNVALVVLLLLIPGLQAITARILWRAQHAGPPIMALTERLMVSLAGLLSSLLIAIVTVDRLIPPSLINPPVSTIVVLAALAINGAPPAVFVWLWSSGRFNDDELP